MSQINEEYKCLCLSTSHMTKVDENTLRCMINASETNMATKRDTGFFVKLYEDQVSNLDSWVGMGADFHAAMNYALEEGYRLIEFDCDAQVNDNLRTHDW